MLYLCKVTMA